MAMTFKRPPAQTTTAGQPASPTQKSRFAGIQMGVAREPMPEPGTYKMRVISHEEKTSPKPPYTVSFRAKFEILEAEDGSGQRPGDVVFVLFPTSGGGKAAGLSRVKALVASALDIVEADDVEIAKACDDACIGATGRLVGCEVYCVVTKGGPVKKDGVPTGDYYREYQWFPASAEASE